MYYWRTYYSDYKIDEAIYRKLVRYSSRKSNRVEIQWYCTFIPTGESSRNVAFLLWTFFLFFYTISSTILRFSTSSSSGHHLIVFLLPPGRRGTSVDVWPSTRAASFRGFVTRLKTSQCSRFYRSLSLWDKRQPWVSNSRVEFALMELWVLWYIEGRSSATGSRTAIRWIQVLSCFL